MVESQQPLEVPTKGKRIHYDIMNFNPKGRVCLKLYIDCDLPSLMSAYFLIKRVRWQYCRSWGWRNYWEGGGIGRDKS